MRSTLIAVAVIGTIALPASMCGATALEGQFLPGTGAMPRASATSAVYDTIGQFAAGISAGESTTLQHGFWHWDQGLQASKFGLPDGAFVELRGKTVSAGTEWFGAAFYIQEDHVAGIRIEWTGGAVPTGAVVTVCGTLQTSPEFERYIEASYVGAIGAGEAAASGMNNKTVGGADSPGYDPLTGRGQRGVVDGFGLNNIGLLIKTTGQVTAVGSSFFYIDDGTRAQDNSIFGGVRVLCGSMAKPASGYQVSVTGISSIMMIRDQLFRYVRPRCESDVEVIAP